MNDALLIALGFQKEVACIKAHTCPLCNTEIDMSKFRDECSKREYKISGICQVCQDSISNNNDE